MKIKKNLLIFVIILILSILIFIDKNEEEKVVLYGTPIDSWSNSFECENIKSCDVSYTLVKPDTEKSEGAKLLITKDKQYAGKYSLYSYVPSAKFEGIGSTSKAMVAQKEFIFTSGNTIIAEAWFYIPSSSKGRVTVMDFENSEKIGNPGIRFQLQEDMVIFNRDKIKIKPYTFESATNIPYDEWFLMRVELILGDENNGQVKILINNAVVMNEKGATISQTIKNYDTFQVGITARLDNPYTMWTDEVSVYINKNNIN
ncbi:hypothetical protein K8R42_02155 [bacterium]|nr:hypothetical protein [bacterium]